MEKIPDILDRLGIKYSSSNNRYFFSCPVHGGDNSNGCTIFADNKLCWKCWTQSCHEEYGSGIFGFVRGALTRAKGKNVTYTEVASFLGSEYCIKQEYDPLAEKYTPSSLIEYKRIQETFLTEPNRNYEHHIDRAYAIRNLNIPSPYYLAKDHPIQSSILTKFDIGDCTEGYMEGRAVTPIYNENYRFVGNAGRKIGWQKGDGPKWTYDSTLEKGHHLYGLNLARQYILDSGTCILVEGQANIWRLWEAGFPNCVGIMGASLTEHQLILLEKSGCTTVVLMMDLDQAGAKATLQIKKVGGRRFNYVGPELIKGDPEEHTAEELREILGKCKVNQLITNEKKI